MPVLLVSDAYPPGQVGGAAWSSATLAAVLHAHGVALRVVVPTTATVSPAAPRDNPADNSDAPPVFRWQYHAPPVPFVQNYYRHEVLWRRLAPVLVAHGRALQQQHPTAPLVIHAQHVQSMGAAVLAARHLRARVVVTVRDHWAWDYFNTGLHGNRTPYPTAAAYRTWRGVAALATDLPARLGAVRGALALPAIGYMRAHVRRRGARLAQADAVIAVSGYIRNRLSLLVPPERLHVVPNMVLPATVQAATHPATTPLPPAYLLFVGKLEANKGAALLPAWLRAVRQHAPDLPLPPLVVAGDGALRASLHAALTALGVTLHLLDWVPHAELLRVVAGCRVLLFPSLWGEPLSRVLLEACAIGVPIVATPSGGTPDIVQHGQTGLLARTPAQAGQHIAHVLQHPAAAAQLAAGARAAAQHRYTPAAVLPRVLAVYGAV